MKYTEKYHLPQWVETDRVLMEDFNQMCEDMEKGLADNAAEAAGAARKAQETAEQAVQDAAKAQAKADAAYSPDQKPYVKGTYTGTGAAQTITVGFCPSFVIITSGVKGPFQYSLMVAPESKSYQVDFTGTGFVVKQNIIDPSSREEAYPRIVNYGTPYNYIAFR